MAAAAGAARAAAKKVTVKSADMSEDMQQDAIEMAGQALERYTVEKDMAAFIKKVGTHTDTHHTSRARVRDREGERAGRTTVRRGSRTRTQAHAIRRMQTAAWHARTHTHTQGHTHTNTQAHSGGTALLHKTTCPS
jgi:hypothetical protein